MIKTLLQFQLAYGQLPYKRRQDLIKIVSLKYPYRYVLCLVDGWNELSLKSDVPGRKVARQVAQLFPKHFMSLKTQDVRKRVEYAAQTTDNQIMRKFPMCATSVAAFLFHGDKEDIIITIGDPEVYLWSGKAWYKPQEIYDYALDPAKFSSNVARFFGCPQRKQEKIYSAKPDVVTSLSNTPVILATDGIKDVLSLGDINLIVGNPRGKSPKKIIGNLLVEIQKRKAQKDDISILLRSQML